MPATRGRHASPRPDDTPESRYSCRELAALALLLGGRLIPVAAVAAVAWSRFTRPSWEGAPLDDAGFTTAWQPAVAASLCFVLGFALPFVVLPVGSSALATRDGRSLTVRTVLGRRTVELASARTWAARAPGRGHGLQLVVVRSRTGWAVLAASEVWSDHADPIAGLVDFSARDGRWSREARGWVLIPAMAATAFACFGLGGSLAGTF